MVRDFPYYLHPTGTVRLFSPPDAGHSETQDDRRRHRLREGPRLPTPVSAMDRQTSAKHVAVCPQTGDVVETTENQVQSK